MVKENIIDKTEFLPNTGDLIITKIYFGKKDGLLTDWVQSIPKGRFSVVIKDTVKAYISKDTSYALPKYPMPDNRKKVVTKSLSIGKADYKVYLYLFSVNRYMRSNEIKRILSFYYDKKDKQLNVKEISESPKTKNLASNSEQSEEKKQKKQNPAKVLAEFGVFKMNKGHYE